MLRDATHRLPSIVGYLSATARDHDRARLKANPLRRLYGTARWQRLRWSVLVRDLFTCSMCNRVFADTSQLVADHITPHRGNIDLFWVGIEGLQCLCGRCHNVTKQREEAVDRARTGG